MVSSGTISIPSQSSWILVFFRLKAEVPIIFFIVLYCMGIRYLKNCFLPLQSTSLLRFLPEILFQVPPASEMRRMVTGEKDYSMLMHKLWTYLAPSIPGKDRPLLPCQIKSLHLLSMSKCINLKHFMQVRFHYATLLLDERFEGASVMV